MSCRRRDKVVEKLIQAPFVRSVNWYSGTTWRIDTWHGAKAAMRQRAKCQRLYTRCTEIAVSMRTKAPDSHSRSKQKHNVLGLLAVHILPAKLGLPYSPCHWSKLITAITCCYSNNSAKFTAIGRPQIVLACQQLHDTTKGGSAGCLLTTLLCFICNWGNRTIKTR